MKRTQLIKLINTDGDSTGKLSVEGQSGKRKTERERRERIHSTQRKHAGRFAKQNNYVRFIVPMNR